MTLEEIKEAVAGICKKHGVKELYLFGSYATGTETATSDIDFFVKGCENPELVAEECEEIPTLKKIDIFDYDRCDNTFLKEAMDRYGRKIYGEVSDIL